jgi:hypothetical protein
VAARLTLNKMEKHAAMAHKGEYLGKYIIIMWPACHVSKKSVAKFSI